ncbi:3-oxoacyl-ACP reductase, partial [Escherichia coli]|nr:3-oxoacyl-ACP reductase [Escherichia coli]
MCHYIDSDLNSRAPRILLIGASRGIGLAMAE